MDAKAMTPERLAQIDAALVDGGEYVGTENEMTHTDGVTALNFAWELLAEVRRLRAVEEKAKVLLKDALSAVDYCAERNKDVYWEGVRQDGYEREAATIRAFLAAPNFLEGT